VALSAKDLIAKLKRATLDKTDLDERISQGIKRIPQQSMEGYRPYYNRLQYNLNNPSPQAVQFVNKWQPRVQKVEQNLMRSPVGLPGRGVQGYAGNLLGNEIRAGQGYRQAYDTRTAKPLIGATWNTAKSIGQVAPVGRLASYVPAVLSGAIGAGVNAYQGKNIAQGFGSGAGEAMGWRPVLSITNPITSKLGIGLANKVSSPQSVRLAKVVGQPMLRQKVASQVAQRGVGGVGNLIEDEILARLDKTPINNTNRMFSLALGVAMSGNDKAMQRMMSKLGNKAPEIAKTTAKEIQEVNNGTKSFTLSYLDNGEKKIYRGLSKQDASDWTRNLLDRGLEWDLKTEAGSPGRLGSAPKPPTDPLEALKTEVRKYKNFDIKQFFDKNYDKLPQKDQRVLDKVIYGMRGDYNGDAYLFPKEQKVIDRLLGGKNANATQIKKVTSTTNKTNVFPSFNEYYSLTGGYKGVSQGRDVTGDYINGVIDQLNTGGKKNSSYGMPTAENIKDARNIIKTHSLRRDSDLARLENAVSNYNQSQLPKTGLEAEATLSDKSGVVNRLDNQALQAGNEASNLSPGKLSPEQPLPPKPVLSSPDDLVNTSAKANQLPQTQSQLTKANQSSGKLTKSQSQPYFNTKNLNVSKKAKKQIAKVVQEVKPQIEKATGKKLTNKQVIEKANQSAKVLNGAVGKDQTLAWEASLLKARQKLAALADRGVVDREYIDTLMTVKTYGTDIARKLQSFGIGADAELVTSKQAILEAVLKTTDDADAVLKASQGVDFNDLQQATAFYRQFVKPTKSEWVDLLRYNSMLSSPNTHINNAFSNAQGTGLVAPIEKTVEGSLDAMRSAITGKPRTIFAGEGVRYAKGYYSNIGTAAKRFTDVMTNKQQIKNPDMRHLRLAPTGKGAKVESVLNYPMRLLEAADQFFSAMTEGGSKQALEYRATKLGKPIADLDSVAQKEAAERLFRSDLGDNQGSYALDAIDAVANTVQGLKNHKNPIVSTMAKFTLPFLRTPTNLLKQGVEFSPVGLATLPGAKNKQQLIARSIMGSSIALGTSMLLGSDRLTWAEPTGEKQRNAFRAAGLQPYSVKIGDNWVSYSKLHPAVSFNVALVAALKDSHDKGDIDDTQLDTILGGLAKWMNFYADQSYMKNIGDIVSATKGDIYGLSKMVSNYPQQLIPFRALMGWVNRIIEPYQRQVSSDAGKLEKQFQYLATQIPGLSGIVPLRLSPSGEPIENQHRLINAVSPVRITTQTKPFTTNKSTASISSSSGTPTPVSIPQDQTTFNELYKKALSNGTDFPTNKTLIENDPTLTEDEKVEKIEKLRTETAQWAETLITMQDKYPKQVFTAELGAYKSGGKYTVEERGDWAIQKLERVKDEKEAEEMINRMWEEGVLTTGSSGVAEYLKDLGFDVYTYTGKNEKVKKKVSSGKKGKKVTLGKAPSIKSVSYTPTRSQLAKIDFKTNFKRLNLPKTPKTTQKKVNLMAMSDKLTKRQSKSII